MIIFLLEKFDKLKTIRNLYCSEKETLFLQLKTQNAKPDTTTMFKYNFFCKNTRSNNENEK